MLTAFAYIADVWILATYAATVRGGHVRPFHWANAIGSIPILAVETIGRVWPAFILTFTFGLIGWIGVLRK